MQDSPKPKQLIVNLAEHPTVEDFRIDTIFEVSDALRKDALTAGFSGHVQVRITGPR